MCGIEVDHDLAVENSSNALGLEPGRRLNWASRSCTIVSSEKSVDCKDETLALRERK